MQTTLARPSTQKRNKTQRGGDLKWNHMPKSKFWDMLLEGAVTAYTGKTDTFKNLPIMTAFKEIHSKVNPKLEQKDRRGENPGWHAAKAWHKNVVETLELMDAETKTANANTKSTIEASLARRMENPLETPTTGATDTALQPQASQPQIRLMTDTEKVLPISTELPIQEQMLQLLVAQLPLKQLVGLQHMVTARMVEMIVHAKQAAQAKAQ